MKVWIAWAFVAFGWAVVGAAAGQRPETYSYDWQGHQRAVGELFAKEHAKEFVELERRKIALLLPAEKVGPYMKYFEQGLRSDAGVIMIEGEAQQWLEMAYQSGFRCKQLFLQGYLAGEAHRAGDPQRFTKKIE